MLLRAWKGIELTLIDCSRILDTKVRSIELQNNPKEWLGSASTILKPGILKVSGFIPLTVRHKCSGQHPQCLAGHQILKGKQDHDKLCSLTLHLIAMGCFVVEQLMSWFGLWVVRHCVISLSPCLPSLSSTLHHGPELWTLRLPSLPPKFCYYVWAPCHVTYTKPTPCFGKAAQSFEHDIPPLRG
jgi:hypothetical protein